MWHGSASSTSSIELAARFGDPLYSANGFRPIAHYLDLVRHYRDRLVHHGHDPAGIPLGVGAHSPVIAARSQDAFALARPAFERFRAHPAAAQNGFAYTSLEDFVERGSALVGSPAQVADKLLSLHRAFDNDLFGVGFEGFFHVDVATTRRHLERFFADVVPVVRAEVGPRAAWPDGGE